jgi:hypothetical protein
MKPKIKRLTRLKISSVDAVDRGAGEGVRIMLMKRDRPRFVMGPAFNLIPAADDTGEGDGVAKGSTSLEKALAEIAETRQLAKSLAVTKAHAAPLTEDHPMETSEVMKAAVAKVDDRIAVIMKREPTISRDVAYLRLSSSTDDLDQEAWQIHKQLATVPATPVSAPAPVTVSEAYAKMQKKAAKLAKRENISQASAFAKIYQARPDLAQADKQFFFTGGSVPVGKGLESVVFDNMCRAIRASFPGISDAQVRHWVDLTLQGKPPKEMLTVRTRDAA